MKRQHYPGAYVPEHLTSLTIEKLPIDRPYYVPPGDADDYDPPKIFITHDRILRMARDEIIDSDCAFPSNPIGQVGIMRTLLPDETAGFREVFVADLRFIDNHQIVDIASPQSIADGDQEDFMDWSNMVANSVPFVAFIAPEFGEEFDIDEKVPSGVLYGEERYHKALKKLRKRGNKIMGRFMERQAKPEQSSEGATAAESSSTAKDKESAKPKDLSVYFSGKQK